MLVETRAVLVETRAVLVETRAVLVETRAVFWIIDFTVGAQHYAGKFRILDRCVLSIA